MTQKEPNDRQKRFIDEYLANGGNGAQAAIAAGYSERMARSHAHKLLNLPSFAHVQERIRAGQGVLKEKTGATAEAKREKLWAIAQAAGRIVPDPDTGIDLVIDAKGCIAAIAELNKMDGDHAAKKVETNHVYETLQDVFDEIQQHRDGLPEFD